MSRREKLLCERFPFITDAKSRAHIYRYAAEVIKREKELNPERNFPDYGLEIDVAIRRLFKSPKWRLDDYKYLPEVSEFRKSNDAQLCTSDAAINILNGFATTAEKNHHTMKTNEEKKPMTDMEILGLPEDEPPTSYKSNKGKVILEFSEKQQSFYFNHIVNGVPERHPETNGYKTILICSDQNEAVAFCDFFEVQYLQREIQLSFTEVAHTIRNLKDFISYWEEYALSNKATSDKNPARMTIEDLENLGIVYNKNKSRPNEFYIGAIDLTITLTEPYSMDYVFQAIAAKSYRAGVENGQMAKAMEIRKALDLK